MRDRIVHHFQRRRTGITLKYMDPSYHIRSVPASPADSVYCWNLARNAVHAALDTAGDLWAAVVESTGQPHSFSS